MLVVLVLLPFERVEAQEPARLGTALSRFSTSCGEKIVFSARSQLWSVSKYGGSATPLTSGPGQKIAARCSPDDKWVAYMLNSSGSRDIYVISSNGGTPRRLTFRPTTTNVVVSWTPDSKAVVFLSSQRDWVGQRLTAFSVPLTGGLATPLGLDQAGDLTFSADGQTIAYTRFLTDFRMWKRYEGGEAPKVFLYHFANHQQQQLTHWKGTDTAPMWYRNRIYFLSDRDGQRRKNIWMLDRHSGRCKEITHFTDFDIDTPSLNDGVITFSHAGTLWRLQLQDQSLQSLNVSVPDDGTLTAPREISAESYVRVQDTDYDVDYAISKDGRAAILDARGDLFRLSLDGASTANLTSTSNAEEDHPAISSDGALVAYTTDISGEQQLAVRPLSGGAERILTHFTSGVLFRPVWSPDGQWIAIHDGAHKLWLVNVGSGEARIIGYNRDHFMHETDEHDAVFSPDSRYIAFSLSRPTRLRSMHVYDVARSTDHILSTPDESDYRPAFSSDGRFLYFVSDRHEIPVYADRETNAVTINSAGLYVSALYDGDIPPFQKASDGLPFRPGQSLADRSRGEVEFSQVMKRSLPVPIIPTKISDLQVRGDQLFYQADPPPVMGGSLPGASSTLHLLSADGRDRVLVTGLSSFVVSGDGSRILYVHDEHWFSLAVGEKNASQEIKLSGLKATVSPPDEWREMFWNSWRLERDLYINADMNQVDWYGVRRQYAALLPLVASRADLNWLIGEMLGELAGSHLSAGGGDEGVKAPIQKPVLLGADYALDKNTGRYYISQIYGGDNSRPYYRSPLTWPGVNAHEGDFLLAINGQELTFPNSPDEMLSATNGPVSLTLAKSPTGARRSVSVDALESEVPVRELARRVQNRKLVDQLSNDRIAYVAVTDMQRLGMEQFVQQFYPQLGKDGLILDDRGNPGGNIDEMLLERLRRRISSLQTGRDRVPQTQPDQVLTGPKVMLIDGYSASDGEVFPLHFREYGLGQLIGSRTWGGVRGLRTYWTLLDGGTVVIPEISFYDKRGKWLVENHGVDPNFPVDQSPAAFAAGEDPALALSVRLLMRRLPPRHVVLPRPETQSDYPRAGTVPPAFLPRFSKRSFLPQQHYAPRHSGNFATHRVVARTGVIPTVR